MHLFYLIKPLFCFTNKNQIDDRVEPVSHASHSRLYKRQAIENPSNKGRKRKTNSSNEQDKKSLEIAKMFFENDKIHLSEAMQSKNMEYKNGHSSTTSIQGERHSPITKRINELHEMINRPPSPSDKMHLSEDIPAPFSKDVIRRKKRKTGPNEEFFTDKNYISVQAENLIKKGKTANTEEAIQLARSRLKGRKARAAITLRNWKNILSIDPSQARFLKTEVPKNISMKLYIPARAHQLNQRGAGTMEETMRTAEKEALEHLEKSIKNNIKYRAKQKDNKKS